ncbi:5-carboxymethyl-2-hydroxymuconate Delta-isomerase [Streptomyces sp. NPDC007971]|uniref:5-carboxymethyl-2-hydroxymuconate Delta-isomerase n=1 Tax=Streptomyces sp. NPDC007971 TaxID=3364799 RepID=UPI0036E193B9
MPHITVDYSESLSDAFDRRGFALELHPLTAEVIKDTVDNCKTRFRRVEETFVADGAPEHAVIHVEFVILQGRTETVKAELSHAVLELIRKHVASTPGVMVHTSVDVSELGKAYRKHVMV